MRRRVWLRTAIIAILAAAPAAAELKLEPCAEQFGEKARCGWADVAEDRTEPEGRRIRIRVVVLPTDSAEPAEPVLFFPGGPGQATPTLIPKQVNNVSIPRSRIAPEPSRSLANPRLSPNSRVDPADATTPPRPRPGSSSRLLSRVLPTAWRLEVA